MNLRPRLLHPLLLSLLAAPAASLFADVKPSALFQDHAVLQREKPVPVWGVADAGEKVTVTFAGQSLSTTADAAGRWSVTLAPLPTSATPATLTIAGKNTVTLSDIVVGEVWLASGQSNMEWIVNNMHDADLERRTARFPLIREIKVKKTPAAEPASTFQGEWRAAAPDTVGTFSAVAYAFAKDVHLALDVPVGIINSSWGGTPVEAWMSPAALASDPAFAVVRERWQKTLADYPAKKSAYDIELAAWQAEKAAAEAAGTRFTKMSPRAPQGPDSPHAPAVLHNGMIAPLLPSALRGAIWYQGESNAGRASEYHALFSSMITGWRSDFAQGNFPFFWVQLAAFKSGRADATEWAFLREAQTRTLALPATGQAVILDAALSDFGDIHPRAKIPVGRRLARLALARAYGDQALADSGPVFASFEPVAANLEATPAQPAALRVSFTGGEGKIRQPAPTVTGFEIAGEDRVFHPADARLDNGSVIVSAAAVPAPVAVRYAWRNHPVAGLQDNLGLPVAPFRSDTW
ncbi:MAG: sialate O-acetylesterase [Burkholderiales bacterium]|nr:sialate O-acetylesterase [Opitutaceae bacterium]